ncbi:hypothetical protein JT359_19665 [Candidatus Poribacteria bacterium]|nr:hypothetical protein [Candidatus Poribacteria bacterium]
MYHFQKQLLFFIFMITTVTFVASSADAQIFTATAQVTEYRQGATATTDTPAVQGKWVITLKFSAPLKPKLTADLIYRHGGLGVNLGPISNNNTTDLEFNEIDASTYTLTRLGAPDGNNTPGFYRLSFYGYIDEPETTFDNSRQGRNEITPDNPGTVIRLRTYPSYIPPFQYYVIGRHLTAEHTTPSRNEFSNFANNQNSEYPRMPETPNVRHNNHEEQLRMPIRRVFWS